MRPPIADDKLAFFVGAWAEDERCLASRAAREVEARRFIERPAYGCLWHFQIEDTPRGRLYMACRAHVGQVFRGRGAEELEKKIHAWFARSGEDGVPPMGGVVEAVCRGA